MAAKYILPLAGPLVAAQGRTCSRNLGSTLVLSRAAPLIGIVTKIDNVFDDILIGPKLNHCLALSVTTGLVEFCSRFWSWVHATSPRVIHYNVKYYQLGQKLVKRFVWLCHNCDMDLSKLLHWSQLYHHHVHLTGDTSFNGGVLFWLQKSLRIISCSPNSESFVDLQKTCDDQIARFDVPTGEKAETATRHLRDFPRHFHIDQYPTPSGISKSLIPDWIFRDIFASASNDTLVCTSFQQASNDTLVCTSFQQMPIQRISYFCKLAICQIQNLMKKVGFNFQVFFSAKLEDLHTVEIQKCS